MSHSLNCPTILFDCDFDIDPKVIDCGFTPDGGGGVVIRDYDILINKPQINGVELIGDRTAPELNLQYLMFVLTDSEIDRLIFGEELIPDVQP